MKCNIKHFDVDGIFYRLDSINVPENIDVIKVSFVLETPSSCISVYDTFTEIVDKVIKKNSYTWKDDYSTLIVDEKGTLKEYKIKTQFYYLERDKKIDREIE